MERFNKIVKEYAEKQVFKAIERAEKEKCGEGCGCASCAKLAVRNANEWISWTVPEDSPFKDCEIYQTAVHRGRTVVEGGFTGKGVLDNVRKRLGGGGDAV